MTSCGQNDVNLDPYRLTQFSTASEAYAGHKFIPAAQNAFQLSQRYALERFCEAAASRDAVPPPNNGSIFTMDMPAGVMGFDRPKPHPVSPDGSWRTVHQGQVFGTIYAKAFAPVTAQQVRLNINAKVVQFDLFKK